MKYFSLFSGIGGFEYGIEKANQKDRERIFSKDNLQSRRNKPNNERRTWGCYTNIGYSEIDKYAEAIYRFHYPEHKNYGDATRIIPEELPDFDFLCAGFPCQAFSIAGKRKGFDDTRGTLFFEICRIAGAKRPNYLLLENVRGLLSHNEGRTFLVILQSLDELGYDLQWQVLNSKDWGVPQNRERVFIVGHIRGKPRPEVFPVKFQNEQTLKLLAEITGETPSGLSRQGDRLWGTDGLSPTITSQLDCSIPKILDRDISDGYIFKRKKKRNNVKDKVRKQDRDPTGKIQGSPFEETPKGNLWESRLREQDKEDCNIHRRMFLARMSHPLQRTEIEQGLLDSQNGEKQEKGQTGDNEIEEDGMEGHKDMGARIRRLTPVECERLQGFPDNWTKWGMMDGRKVEISDTQRYKCLGNAVTTNVIQTIMERWQCSIST